LTKLVQLARLELLIPEMGLVIKVSYPSCSVERCDTEVQGVDFEYTQIEMLNRQVWEKIKTRETSTPVRDRTASSALGKSGFREEHTSYLTS
jgi:hypothetical protein